MTPPSPRSRPLRWLCPRISTLAALAGVLLWQATPVQAQEPIRYNSFSMVFMSDPQLPWWRGEPTNPPGQNDPVCDYDTCIEIWGSATNAWAVNAINNMADLGSWPTDGLTINQNKPASVPHGVIINGDLTAYWHQWQFELYHEIYGRLQRPRFEGLGNHDYANNVNDCNGIGWLLDSNRCAKEAFWYMASRIGEMPNIVSADVPRFVAAYNNGWYDISLNVDYTDEDGVARHDSRSRFQLGKWRTIVLPKGATDVVVRLDYNTGCLVEFICGPEWLHLKTFRPEGQAANCYASKGTLFNPGADAVLCEGTGFPGGTSGSLAYSFEIGNYHFVQLQNYPGYEVTLPNVTSAGNFGEIFSFGLNSSPTVTVTPSFDWLRRDVTAATAAGKNIIINFHDLHDHAATLNRNTADGALFYDAIVDANVVGIFGGHIHQTVGQIGTYNNGLRDDIPVFRTGSVECQTLIYTDLHEGYFNWSVVSTDGGVPSWENDEQWTCDTGIPAASYTTPYHYPMIGTYEFSPEDIFDAPLLTVNVSPAASGSVAGTGIDCPADDCSQNVPLATDITLTAAPQAGWQLARWEGFENCIIPGPTCVVTMYFEHDVTAFFEPIPQTLTLNKSGDGSGQVISDLVGIDCGIYCSGTAGVYGYSDIVTLTAVPANDAQFMGWSGAAGCGLALTCVVDLTADRSITAQFGKKPRLTIYKQGGGTGIVTGVPAGIDCGADCSRLYPSGTTVSLTAIAGSGPGTPDGAAFGAWGGDPDCLDGSVTLDADTVCTASFVQTEYDLAVEAYGLFGSGTVTSADLDIDCGLDCSETYQVADFPTPKVATLTATPAPGSVFGGWSGGYDCVPTQQERSDTGGATISLTMNGDISCRASFLDAGEEFTLTVQKFGGGFGSIAATPAGDPPGFDCGEPVCSQTYSAATEVMLMATPLRGSKFTGFTGDSQCEFPTGPGGGVVMASDLICNATFELPVLVVDDDHSNDDSTCRFGEQNSDVVCQAYMSTLGQLNQSDRPNPIEDPPDPSLDNVPEFSIGSDDVWKTRTQGYPTFADLQSYSWVVWFTGGEPQAVAGPDAAGEAALAQWLEQEGGCLAISSQDYYADRQAGGMPTAFMHDYLGIDSVTNDGGPGLTSVTGAGPVWSGFGPYSLSYNDQVPVGNFVDVLVPAEGAQLSFEYSPGSVAGVQRDNGTYRTVYLGFPLEVLSAGGRNEAMRELIDFCHDNPQRVLTVPAPAGSGTGTVTPSAPANGGAGGGFDVEVNSGTVVTLTAAPAAGSTFLGWTGGVECGLELICDVQLEADQTVTAEFAASRTVTAAASGTGSGSIESTPAGIDCGATCAASFAQGTTVAYTAMPASGSVLVGWSGAAAACGAAPVCAVVVDGDQAVTAEFGALRTVVALTSGLGTGTVVSSPAGISCGVDCSEPFAAGTTITLTAVPDAGSGFVAWTGGDCGTNPVCDVAVDADQVLTAQFEATRNLMLSSVGTRGGTVTSDSGALDCAADCTVPYAEGLTTILTVTPDPGAEFLGWGGDLVHCGTNLVCEVAVSADLDVTVNFGLTHSLTVVVQDGTVISLPAGIDCGSDCSDSFGEHEPVTLVATPARDHIFAGWSTNCGAADAVIQVTLAADETCGAAFMVDPDADSDGDGILNGADPDDDNDGLADADDDYPVGRFDDALPGAHWAFGFIEALARAGVTSGCGPLAYCPDDPVTRAQMAVFLERGMRGSGFRPPAATGNTFLDVSASAFAASFIEQLFLDGITNGCGNNNYCPANDVTRAQMAVFLLRAEHGAGYTPPPPSGTFDDVDASYWAASWIEQLAAEGITSGCGANNYCPENPVTRAQMAVFLVRTFGL